MKNNPAFNTLAKRTVSGLVVAALVVGSLLWSHYSFLVLLAVICVGGLLEFYSMAAKAGAQPQKWLGILCGLYALFIFDTVFPSELMSNAGTVSIIALIFIIFIRELYRKKENPLANIATTVMGIIYVAFPLGLLAHINMAGQFNMNYVILGFILLVWANDVGAYLVGVALGRKKLFERVSPKKSWEGFFGGLAFAVGMGVLIAWLTGRHGLTDGSMIYWAGLAIVVVISGVFGDLVESLLKRSVMLKDSGDIIPGHGGFLDRFDAMLFAVPFVYLYFVIFAALT